MSSGAAGNRWARSRQYVVLWILHDGPLLEASAAGNDMTANAMVVVVTGAAALGESSQVSIAGNTGTNLLRHSILGRPESTAVDSPSHDGAADGGTSDAAAAGGQGVPLLFVVSPLEVTVDAPVPDGRPAFGGAGVGSTCGCPGGVRIVHVRYLFLIVCALLLLVPAAIMAFLSPTADNGVRIAAGSLQGAVGALALIPLTVWCPGVGYSSRALARWCRDTDVWYFIFVVILYCACHLGSSIDNLSEFTSASWDNFLTCLRSMTHLVVGVWCASLDALRVPRWFRTGCEVVVCVRYVIITADWFHIAKSVTASFEVAGLGRIGLAGFVQSLALHLLVQLLRQIFRTYVRGFEVGIMRGYFRAGNSVERLTLNGSSLLTRTAIVPEQTEDDNGENTRLKPRATMRHSTRIAVAIGLNEPDAVVAQAVHDVARRLPSGSRILRVRSRLVTAATTDEAVERRGDDDDEAVEGSHDDHPSLLRYYPSDTFVGIQHRPVAAYLLGRPHRWFGKESRPRQFPLIVGTYFAVASLVFQITMRIIQMSVAFESHVWLWYMVDCTLGLSSIVAVGTLSDGVLQLVWREFDTFILFVQLIFAHVSGFQYVDGPTWHHWLWHGIDLFFVYFHCAWFASMDALSPPGGRRWLKIAVRCLLASYLLLSTAVWRIADNEFSQKHQSLHSSGVNADGFEASITISFIRDRLLPGMAQSTMMLCGLQCLKQAVDLGLKRVEFAAVTKGWKLLASSPNTA